MKKRITGILIAVAAVAFSYFGITMLLYYSFSVIMWPWSMVYDYNKAIHLDDSKYLKETYPTEIKVFGDEILEPGMLPIEHIEQLDKCLEDDNNLFRVVVINDRHDKLSLTADDMKIISDYVDKGWCICYLGSKYLTDINDMFFDTEFDNAEGEECSLGVIKYNGTRTYGFQGFWTKGYDDDDAILRNLLVATIKNESKRYYEITRNMTK